MATVGQARLGRAGAGVLEKVRRQISSGKLRSGIFLSSVRTLADEHDVGVRTVCRILKVLESEGLVAARPRRGYQVLARANDPDRGCPIAYIIERTSRPETWDPFHSRLFTCLQEAASARGWSTLALGAGGLTAGELTDRLKCARSFGAVVDSDRAETVAAVKSAGLPCLMLEAWRDDAGIDAVLQNGHMGGGLAAKHLLSRGARRIAWFGMPPGNFHAADRLGGALAALAEAGLSPEMKFVTERPAMEDEARQMLSRPDRPDGVLALWQGYAMAVKRAADSLGLVLGRDLHLVGWCAEEILEDFYRPGFGAGRMPPTITWSIRAMAEAAMSRLAERRQTAGLAPMWLKVPVALREDKA
jgi:LacI family repressor for deo operon, udp, cdd, tsx, nupC, and nupG